MFRFTTTASAAQYSDEELLSRAQGEPWLFSILLERYQDAFLRKALGIIKNQQDAEEIVQDTFTKIYFNAHTFTPQAGAKFSSWGYRILMNTAFTYYQKRVKQGARFVNIDPEFEQLLGDRAGHAAFNEHSDGVARILARLPAHLAYVLRLHYLERWSHQDIARDTGENVGTIKARIHRAKIAFRKEGKTEELEALL